MALEIIGSGLGRTGTKSLHAALELLGFGPCHHMVEVFAHRESVPLWIEAAEGRPDWNAIFRNYRSAVDYPTAAYWRELATFYPDAKIIHTLRDPDQWFDSTQATIFRAGGPPDQAIQAGGMMGDFFGSILRPFGDKLHDRAFMTDYFRRHTDEVRAEIPPGRLLFYDVSEGWGPLCAFLGVNVPPAEFPFQNTRAEFIARAPAVQ